MARAPARPRVALSRERILDAAFRVVDADPRNEITTSRLGKELGADPSAMYRHFRDKDDLLLAMADAMLVEVVDSYVEGEAPVENLRRMSLALRHSYLRRPGLAREVAARFTGGVAESVAVRHMLRNVAELGYDETATIAHVRALAEMTLGHISVTADLIALPAEAATFELQMARSYHIRPVDPLPVLTPTQQRDEHLADGDAVFSTMLETFLAGLVAQAPSRTPRTSPRTAATRAKKGTPSPR